jgi:hypothetical protein
LEIEMPPFALMTWLVFAFGAELGLAIVVLGSEGSGVTGTTLALDVTARFSFLLFWPVYAGGALAALFGPAFLPLKRHARELGLAFAVAHLVHLGLVVWLCHLGPAPSANTFVIFGVAVFWLYLIAFISAGGQLQRLHPLARQLMFFVGLNYIAFAFAVDFFANPLQGGAKRISFYLPFAALSIAAPSLRLAAFAARFAKSRKAKVSFL